MNYHKLILLVTAAAAAVSSSCAAFSSRNSFDTTAVFEPAAVTVVHETLDRAVINAGTLVSDETPDVSAAGDVQDIDGMAGVLSSDACAVVGRLDDNSIDALFELASITMFNADGAVTERLIEAEKFRLEMSGFEPYSYVVLMMISDHGTSEALSSFSDENVLFANQYRTDESGGFVADDIYPKSVENSVFIVLGQVYDSQ